MVDKQGQAANKNGQWLEDQVETIITDYGLASILHSKINTRSGKKIVEQSEDGVLFKNVPFISAYGTKSRSEFVLNLSGRGPIRIECKFQKVAGSVDEKLHYLVGNLYAFKEKEAIVVLEGDGARKEAKAYVKFAAKKAKNIVNKKIMVFTLNQFKSWANSVLAKN